jgi:hypothetical protein
MQLKGIDIEQNRPRLSRSPAPEVHISPNQAQRRGNICEKSPARSRQQQSAKSNAPWIALSSRAT